MYIYANGGINLGFGHIVRTLALSEKARGFYDVKYFSSYKEEFDTGRRKIKEHFFDVINVNYIEEYLDKDSILIVDSYSISKEELSRLRKRVKLLCYIDDNNHLEYYDVDLIINHNIHGELLTYNSINSKLLVGGKYTLIRDEFLNKTPIKVKDRVEEILVTIGGSDNSNLTNKILREIKHLNYKINVVIGNAFIYKDELINEYKKYSNITFHINPIMSELMIKCDLAISACGSTLYELSYLGIPTLGLIIVDNQRLLGKYMNNKKIIKLSNLKNLYNDLSLMDYETRFILSSNMKSLIDGQGAIRIIKEIELLLYEKGRNNE